MKICEEKLCCGCGECAFVCPKGAVTMERDGEGFSRPAVNAEKCVECGLCQKKCPVNVRDNSGCLDAYAAYSKDEDLRKTSSSGGIFSCIAAEVIRNGGAVFGVGLDENLRAVHKIALSEKELEAFRGSKYVQSDMTGIYPQLKELVSSGKQVLFSGTPCQCSAVRNLFPGCDNLMLVDFICHGVPSPEVWEKYVSEICPGAVSASFRDKTLGWEEFSLRIDDDNKSYCRSLYKDTYLRLFLINLTLRKSCYNCRWKGEAYSSDITLADFWSISGVFPHMNDDKGTSIVITRSEKGRNSFEKIKGDLVVQKTSISTVARVNPALVTSAAVNDRREEFFRDFSAGMDFSELGSKYVKPVSNKEIANVRLKKSIKKLIGKIYRLKNKHN